MRRLILILPAVFVGMAIAGFAPQAVLSALVFAGFKQEQAAVAPASRASAPKPDGGHAHEEGKQKPDGLIEMSSAQIEAAQITIVPSENGVLARRLTVPGIVMADSDRLGRVPAKVVGTVTEMRKRLGDPVAKGEVVAVLDSREIADTKSEYLTASVNFDLQKTMFERAQILWDKRISAEQQYLQARATFAEAELRVDLARQKLSALGLDPQEVAVSAKQDSSKGSASSLRTYEVRAPISGRVVERKVDIGASVGREGDPSELYSVADLSAIWVEIAVPTADLDPIREGQPVIITNGRNPTKRSEGKIVFISPILNQETRSARVIAAVDNPDLFWRPGSFVTAQITIEEQPVEIRVPRAALQTIAGERVVFVRTDAGFERREVVLGNEDDQAVEIVFGLMPGEQIAVNNTFLLKAELGKAEAEHSH
jgi:cobalt-zinc-cadmium efflux system membrane fusion protein